MLAPSVPPSDGMRFRARLRTRWVDEDNQRVLNNAVYMTLLEEARHLYFGELGLLEGNQFPFVLAQTNIRFLAPGRGGALVEVELRTMELGRSSFVQVYRVRDLERATVLCEAEALLVAWDNAAFAKRELSADFRAAIARFEGLER